ncbi:MAG: DUF1822 family protein [Calothrix sp. FI2-JRJ7]|jgi:hypothetical protein|nr:DUF1822 family protein [Calothrix sp. FI2-JRJ7]
MTFESPQSIPIPEKLCLEIPPSSQIRELPSFSTPGTLWQARLNQMCLDAFLAWLREEQVENAIWTSQAALPSFWELINGTAIMCETIRIVLIPTAAIELEELRVPQEWVDIPSWVADYYIAAQVVNGACVTITGYTTHRQLKTKGVYDAANRTYCLDEDDLIQDINVLWIARELCPEEILRESVASLPKLSLVQVNNLIERLGNSAVVFPRIAVPFQLWGALIEHGGWRQGLYERRQGWEEQWSIQQWLQTGVSNLAQQLGWEITPTLRGVRSREPDKSSICLSRRLTLAGNPYELRIFPKRNLEDHIWRFELRSVNRNEMIPPGFKLRVLTEDLQPFTNNEHTAKNAIAKLYVDVVVSAGEGLVWEVEPIADGYDSEILRF